MMNNDVDDDDDGGFVSMYGIRPRTSDLATNLVAK
jgi:hypothetical protein